jgi:maleylpyruvate isomerase
MSANADEGEPMSASEGSGSIEIESERELRAASSLMLYGFWRSSATWRVRIGLHHKGLRFITVPVDLHKDGGEQHKEGYRALNPLRQVPVLEIHEGGRTMHLTQSIAILEYLEERYPDPPLLPRGLVERVQARRLAEVVNAGIQPFQNASTVRHVREVLKADDETWTKHWVARGLEALEAEVAISAGSFCVGDEVSIADICLVPQVSVARRIGVDLSGCPTLVRIDAACASIPAFESARPERQPDAPMSDPTLWR